jgi:hypothetical protein
MANIKALPAKDLEIESRVLSTPPLEAVKSALKKVSKEFFRTCNVLPFSCTHLALWRGKEAR